MKELIKNLNTLANALGYGKLSSYDKLWGTLINTFGAKTASMWTLSIKLNAENQCLGVEIHKTYFRETAQVKLINSICSFDTPKELSELIQDKLSDIERGITNCKYEIIYPGTNIEQVK